MPRTKNIQSAIEALLLDEDGIGQIEARLGGFNIFEAIRHTRAEERHSDFLAFLLNPSETHGLGAEFLTQFLIAAVKAISPESRPLPIGEIVLADFDGCLVLRERHNIDVLCIDEARQFLLAIENKVDSGEHSNQLVRYRSDLEKRYRKFRRVLVYLTPDNSDPSDENWLRIGYGDILSITESLATKHGVRLGKAVTLTLDHYALMLRRHIVKDDELVRLARRVYQKHKVALDYVFEHRPDEQLELSDLAEEMVSSDDRIELIHKTKTSIRFVPKKWKDIKVREPNSMDSEAKTERGLFFEMGNSTDAIVMRLVVGRFEDEDIRKAIFEFARGNEKLFPKSIPEFKKTSGRKTIRTWPMIDKDIRGREPIEELKLQLQSKFKNFMREKFENMVSAVSKAFADDA